MSAERQVTAPEVDDLPEDADGFTGEKPYELKKLKARHKEILALVAQGNKLVHVAKMCDVTPQYIGMMLRMDICKRYIKGICEISETQLDSLFPQVVDAISTSLSNGNIEERLKGARLHMEATKRIGAQAGKQAPVDTADDRLLNLSSRLVDLLREKKHGERYVHAEVQHESTNSHDEGTTQLVRSGQGRQDDETACYPTSHEEDEDACRDEGPEQGSLF